MRKRLLSLVIVAIMIFCCCVPAFALENDGEQTKYTVHFDMEEHGTQLPDQYIEPSGKITEPPVQFADGLMTDGWYRYYAIRDESSRWDFERDVVNKDTTLWTIWKPAHVVTLIPTVPAYDPVEFYFPDGHHLSEYGYDYMLKEFENKTEYVYDGLYLDKACTEYVSSTTPILNNITLYVKYLYPLKELDLNLKTPVAGEVQDPTLTLESSDPKWAIHVDEQGTWMKSLGGDDEYVEMEDGEKFAVGRCYKYSRPFFKFGYADNWIYDPENLTVRINGAKTDFIAEYWILPKEYFHLSFEFAIPSEVTYDMQGHGTQVWPDKVKPGECLKEPTEPTCKFFCFTGWYTSADLDEKFDFTTKINDNMTLYAGWEPATEIVDAKMQIPQLHFNAGDTVQSVTSSYERDVSASKVSWEKSADGTTYESMSSGDEFLPNMYYRAQMTLETDPETPFFEDLSVTVCGSAEGVSFERSTDSKLEVTYVKHLVKTTNIVSFDTLGKGSAPYDQEIEEGLTAEKPSDPREYEYDFCGWYTDTEFKNKFDFATPIVSDIKLYARWRRPIRILHVTLPELFVYERAPENVTVSTEYGSDALNGSAYKADWEAVTCATSIIWNTLKAFEPGQTYRIPNLLVKPVGESYYFTDDLTIVSDLGKAEITGLGSDLVSVCITVTIEDENKPKTQHAVVYRMNGHGMQLAPQYVLDGKKAVEPARPTENGWHFNDWYSDEYCTDKFDFSASVTEDIILYAKWSPVYTVTFNMNGHGTQIDPQNVISGSRVTEPEDPSEAGWLFDGWYMYDDFSREFNFKRSIYGNTEIFAKWTANSYVITEGADSEWIKDSVNGQAFRANIPFEKFTNVKVDNTLVEETNYTAVSGSTLVAFTPDYLETLSIGEHSLIIEATDGAASCKFQVKALEPEMPVLVTVSFDMKGHGIQIDSQTFAENGKATQPTDPTAEGYTFNGWYIDTDLSAKYDFDAAVTSDLTLYAKWIETAEPDVPATWDDSHIWMWLAVLFASIGTIMTVIIYRKTTEKQDKKVHF